MGKSGKYRRKNHSFAAKRRQKQQAALEDKPQPHRTYTEIVKENASFETYYKTQKICSDVDWTSFIAALKEDLPAAFRVTGSRGQAQPLLTYIRENFFEVTDGDPESKVVATSMPWYPDNLAWQLKLTRKDIRRSEAHYRLHSLLVTETDVGFLSRQEVVSMIPPLVLNVEPHHKVLDMCAAPGSKTAQIIEMLHSKDEDGKIPEGLVIANDVDNKRCYMLVHQAKRLNSPCVIITNHDASAMPNFSVTNPDGTTGVLKFDRILCDVPCSGDGTLRKNPDVWQKWHAGNGNNLHGMQFRIVKRGAELLTVGGRLVYSTCSFNPVENEAVVQRILLESEGALSLDEISLPGLKSRQGLHTWTPMSRDLQTFNNFEEVPKNLHTQIRPQLFPCSPEKAAELHLERCVRVLPHHQDTGGFFIAVFEKHSSMPWEASAKEKPETSTNGNSKQVTTEEGEEQKLEATKEIKKGEESPSSPAKKKRKVFGYREDPFIFFDENEPLWPIIRDYYNISSDLLPSLLLTRCQEGKKKNIYLTSKSVRDLVVLNQEKIKLINTGVKVFVRCDNKETQCDFRLAQEGLSIIWPLLGGRIVSVAVEDMVNILINDDPHTPPKIETLSDLARPLVENLARGSCVLVCDKNDGKNHLTLQLVGWRGTMSIRAYIPKNERIHYLRLLGADFSKLETNKFKAKDTEGEEKTGGSGDAPKEGTGDAPKNEEESSDAPKEEVIQEEVPAVE